MEFAFKALDPSGEMVEGKRESASRQALILELQGEGYTLLSLEALERPVYQEAEPTEFHFRGRVKPRVVVFFTRQLAELTTTGIPLLQALESLQKFSVSDKFRLVLNQISTDVAKGKGLDEAFASHPKVFSPLYLALVKAGMRSGTLSKMIGQLADYLERDQDLKDRIRSALSYPTFIFCFSVLLIYGMVAHLLPSFEPIWEQSGLNIADYPITNFLMKISHLTTSFWDEALAMVLLALAGGIFFVIWQRPEAKSARNRWSYKIPVLGPFLQLTVMARVANTLGSLIDSGLTLVESLNLAAQTADSELYSDAISHIAKKVQEGESFAEAFENAGIFPPLMVQMVGIGEESGELSSTLPRLGRYYEGQLELGIKTMSSLVEPVTMVLVGGVVFAFVLGVFLPIMGVVGSLQSQL